MGNSCGLCGNNDNETQQLIEFLKDSYHKEDECWSVFKPDGTVHIEDGLNIHITKLDFKETKYSSTILVTFVDKLKINDAHIPKLLPILLDDQGNAVRSNPLQLMPQDEIHKHMEPKDVFLKLLDWSNKDSPMTNLLRLLLQVSGLVKITGNEKIKVVTPTYADVRFGTTDPVQTKDNRLSYILNLVQLIFKYRPDDQTLFKIFFDETFLLKSSNFTPTKSNSDDDFLFLTKRQKDGNTFIHVLAATDKKRGKFIQELLSSGKVPKEMQNDFYAGKDVTDPKTLAPMLNNRNQTPLVVACREGNLATISELTVNGIGGSHLWHVLPDPKAQPSTRYNNYRPIHLAAKKQCSDTEKILSLLLALPGGSNPEILNAEIIFGGAGSDDDDGNDASKLTGEPVKGTLLDMVLSEERKYGEAVLRANGAKTYAELNSSRPVSRRESFDL